MMKKFLLYNPESVQDVNNTIQTNQSKTNKSSKNKDSHYFIHDYSGSNNLDLVLSEKEHLEKNI